MNARLIHDCPGRRGDEELLVDAVSEAVRDAACHVSNMRRVKSMGKKGAVTRYRRRVTRRVLMGSDWKKQIEIILMMFSVGPASRLCSASGSK